MSAYVAEQNGAFPLTHWSLIYLASNRERAEGGKALGELVETYRIPIQTHLRHRFAADPHQAAEWVDGFVEKRILENDLLRQANKSNGRFRGFLIKSLDRFVVDQIRHDNRKRRKPEGGTVALDGLEDHQTPSSPAAQVDPGDRAWAVEVIEQAKEQAEAFYRRKEKAHVWAVFLHGFFLPLREGIDRPSDAELAARYGFESPAQASNTITTVKRKFGNCVCDVVRQYVPNASQSEIDEEIRELMTLLSGSG